MTIIFEWPTEARVLSALFFALEYQIFFSRLLQGSKGRERGSVFGLCFFMYLMTFGITTQRSYGTVLLLHILLAAFCMLLLMGQFRLQWQYGLFLGVALLLCRGSWNSQFSELIPLLAGQTEFGISFFSSLINLGLVWVMQRWVLWLDAERKMKRFELWVSLFPAGVMFAMRVSIYHYGYYLTDMLSERMWEFFLLMSALLAVATLVSLAVSELHFSHAYLQQELERAEQQLRLQYQSFAEQKRSDEQLKSVYHDMANHLNVLRSLAEEQSVQAYVQELNRELELPLQSVETGNVTLNLLLQQKAKQCREEGLELETAVRFCEGEFLSQMEICTLFANCIDNAREAVCDPEVLDKVIRVNGCVRGGYLVVRFENAVSRPVEREGELPRTGKKEGLHGYGLKNVKRIVEAHDGTLTFSQEEGYFSVIWMMPIPSSC